MDINNRINAALQRAIDSSAGPPCPPRLVEAINYAVFPGGHRIRPRLCLAVAKAHEDCDVTVVDAAMSSIEFLHCASLVHDDMPCFDDAEIRRGKPAVHVAFGEPLALLCGDALIVLAFKTLARAARTAPQRGMRLLDIVCDGVGAPGGIVAGQGWECEDDIPLAEYQRAKTGVLFAAATMAGAAAAGVEHEAWGTFGERMGQAYQIADDLLDRFGNPDVIGKPVGQDALRNRPNAVTEMGERGASEKLRHMIDNAIESIPDCHGKAGLRVLIHEEARRFMSLALSRRAAA
jgi:geranylgeranyl diphosphate synthase type II